MSNAQSKCPSGAVTGLFIALLFSLPCHAITINVPADQSTVQSGVDAASDGDTVLVAKGHYFERINFKGKSILLASRFVLDQDSSHIVNTIIDGDTSVLGFDLIMSVFTFNSHEDSTAELRGFTIQKGSGTVDIFQGFNGGGLFIDSASPTIRNCIIQYNDVETGGGGFYCQREGTPRFIDCLIRNNLADLVGGGGLSANGSRPTFLRCAFVGNSLDGLSILNKGSDIDSCSFIRNIPKALRFVGDGSIKNSLFERNFPFKIADITAGRALIDSCSFVNNGGRGLIGLELFKGTYTVSNSLFLNNENAAIGVTQSIANIDNCLIIGNEGIRGGAIGCTLGGEVTVERCLIAFNESLEGDWGPVWCNPNQQAVCPQPQLFCNNIFGNEFGDWVDCISGQDTLNGNFSADPLFCDTASQDYSLPAQSPNLAGNNTCRIPIGVFFAECIPPDPDTGIDPEPEPIIPTDYALSQNYPNPFNGATTIEYSLPRPDHVRIVVYNILGQVVSELVSETRDAGKHSIQWDGVTSSGQRASSGIYFYELNSEFFTDRRKLLLLK